MDIKIIGTHRFKNISMYACMFPKCLYYYFEHQCIYVGLIFWLVKNLEFFFIGQMPNPMIAKQKIYQDHNPTFLT